MLGVDPRAIRLTWTVFLVAGLLYVLFMIRAAVLVFVLAVLFAYVIWPLVQVAERIWRRLLPRSKSTRLLALAVVYPVLVGLAVLAGAVLVPQIAHQAATLFERLRTYISAIQRGGLLEQMSASRGWSLPVLYAIRDQLRAHAEEMLPYLQSAGAQLLRYVSNLWLVVLVPILAFFLLKDAELLTAGIESWLAGEEEQRGFFRDIFEDLHDLLAQYMRALILLSLLTFFSHAVFFFVAGVPYALLLATLAGMLEFIPMVGPVSAGATIILGSWLAGYEHLLWILIFLALWRLIQDYVNMPWVLGSGVELHPLLVIFGVLAGAELAGVAGMFLSIPTMAAVRILLRRGMGVSR